MKAKGHDGRHDSGRDNEGWNDAPQPSTPNPGDCGEPEWVVNSLAELGVRVGGRFFFLYKGRSLEYESTGVDDEDSGPLMWRRVFEREFGECCHPLSLEVNTKDGSGWERLPPAPQPSTVEPAPCQHCLCKKAGSSCCLCEDAKPTAEEKADPPLHTCWRSLYDPPTKERDCDGCRAELEPTAEEKPATNLDLARGELGRLRAELEEAKKQLGIQDFCFAAVAAERDAARARAEAAEKSLETANGLLREIERGGFVHDYHPAARSDDLAARLRAHLSLKGAK